MRKMAHLQRVTKRKKERDGPKKSKINYNEISTRIGHVLTVNMTTIEVQVY